MRYEMPVMTDEQRSAAIERCLQAIKSLEPIMGNCEISSLLCFRVALAALTADPADFSRGCDAFRHVLYTAPPVPQMKPIFINSDETDSPIDWYAGGKTRDMVIDTLRDAGYEVKE